MKRITFTLLGLCFLPAILAQNANPSTALDNTILSIMDTEKLPGTSTVIVKNGKVVWLQSYGWADVENSVPVTDSTVFLLASVSKVFTGTALKKILEQESISLDAPINTYLPFPVEIPGFESEPITFRQLMTHTSSIKDGAALDGYYAQFDPTISLADCMQRYFSTSGSDYDATDNFHNDAPGTVYDYSNIATALAGYLVERIAEIPFDTYCRNEIFDPLCMNSTDWHLSYFDTLHVARPYSYSGGEYHPYNHYGFADYPDGLLRSNMIDMSRFLAAILNQGSLNGTSIISSSSLAEMLTLQIPDLDDTQGLNWYTEELFVDGNPVTVWGHNGGESGVSTDIYLDPANNIAVGVFSNGEGDCLEICDALMEYGLGLTNGNLFENCTSSLSEETNEQEISVFPNPSSTDITLQFTDLHSERLIVTDVLGNRLQIVQLSGESEVILNRSDFKPGMYFFTLQSADGNMHRSGKVVFE